MGMKNCILGIDTSNYTTSIAVIDEKGNLLFDQRKVLAVKHGERGLRQSDALFQHLVNMPILFEAVAPLLKEHRIQTVAISNRPRPIEGSYMPVFRAAQSFGQTIAYTLNCACKEFSHQENHIEAGKWSTQQTLGDKFIAVHISGGTTEILEVRDNPMGGYHTEIVGGTLDISAGQFIDRIGVKLGLQFPAGKFMDALAKTAEEDVRLSLSVKDTYISFSGPETMANKLTEQNIAPDLIAKAVFQCVGDALKKATINSCLRRGINEVLFVGGVASSQYIRNFLVKSLSHAKIKAYFSDSRYCTDNAVGTALLAIKNKS
ncbi:O-sialoglycoprotein endopeptidase [Clostridiaceae bacterium 35-E11]